jgi:transcriptional regulator with XRE-family HTH domain
MNDMPIGEKIRLARERHNLSQEELARDVGLSTRTVGRIEAGEIKASRGVRQIMQHLRIDEYAAPAEPTSAVDRRRIDEFDPIELAVELVRQLSRAQSERVSTMRDLPDHVRAIPTNEIHGERDTDSAAPAG